MGHICLILEWTYFFYLRKSFASFDGPTLTGILVDKGLSQNK
jgi:hypothetical protein